MRVLLIHNKYQQPGGEDSVFQAEGELLEARGHVVERLVFDNKDMRTAVDKILSGLMILYNLESAALLRRRIIDFAPDVIHVHNFVHLASPSVFFVAKQFRIPVVVTLHNYRLICPSAILFHGHKIYEKSIRSLFPVDAILKGVYRNSRVQTASLATMTSFHNLIGTWRNKVDRFIVLTSFARNKFSESVLRVSKEQLVIKPNFVEDRGVGENIRGNNFLFIGRLTEEKGLIDLLNATNLYDFNLTIIGDGPLRQKVEEWTANRPSVRYLGFQKKDVVISALKNCKALIFPSVWYEGFPVTILEAFSTGTPVIASDIGGLSEIVTDKVNGLLFAPGDEKDLASKIASLIEHPSLATKLAQNARATYFERYTPEKNYELLTGIYTRVLRSGSRMPVRTLLVHPEPELTPLTVDKL